MFMRKRNDHCLNKICLNYVFFLPVGGAGGRRRVGVLGKLFIGAWGKTRNQETRAKSLTLKRQQA
jgi:hypothetical protein